MSLDDRMNEFLTGESPKQVKATVMQKQNSGNSSLEDRMSTFLSGELVQQMPVTRYAIESTPGWATIPEYQPGQKMGHRIVNGDEIPLPGNIEATDSSTGKTVYGRKENNKFIPFDEPLTFQQAVRQIYASPDFKALDANQKKDVINQMFRNYGMKDAGDTAWQTARKEAPYLYRKNFGEEQSLASGLATGAYNLAGMPVDMLTPAVNLASEIAGLPTADKPVMGSQWIKEKMAQAGLYQPYKAKNVKETYLQALAEQAPGLVLPAQQGASGMFRAATPQMNALLTPTLKKSGRAFEMVQKAVPGAIGAGIGTGTARTIAPESPFTEALLGLAGGVAGSIPTIAGSIPANYERLMRKVAPHPPAKYDDAAAMNAYQRKLKAAENIYKLRNEIILADPSSGAAISGRTPRTLKDQVQAIQQMKGIAGKWMGDIQKHVGDSGLMVTSDDVVSEMRKVTKNAGYTDKQVAAAKAVIEDFTDKHGNPLVLSPEAAQKKSSAYNNRAEMHYRNKTHLSDDAAIDAVAANIYRKTINDSFESLGPAYDKVKRIWGSAANIEQDAIRQYEREMAKQAKSHRREIPLADLFSVEALAHGGIGPAVAAKTARELFRLSSSPDRAVRKLYKNLGRDFEDAVITAPVMEEIPKPAPVVMDMKTNTLPIGGAAERQIINNLLTSGSRPSIDRLR